LSKHRDSIDAALLDRIRFGPKDHVWTPPDFLDLGSRASIDQALSRNCKAGILNRAGRGLYQVPRHDPVLGPLGPTQSAMHDLLKRKAQGALFPTGAHAANMLRLSDQVPMRPMHLTTGPTRRVQFGAKGYVVLQHVSPRFVSTKNRQSALVILALRWIGRRHINDDVLARLRRNLSDADRAALPADAACAPDWIARIFYQLAGPISTPHTDGKNAGLLGGTKARP
jgi:hypothetical protein